MTSDSLRGSGGQSEVSICNKALRYLGASEILSLTQGSRESDLCAQNYAEARNELLAAHYWSFATRRALLAPLHADGGDGGGFARAYKLPVDCLAVQRLAGGEPFAVGENGVLRTDASTAEAVMTVLAENPDRYPPLFTEALARRLAAALAVALVNNARLEQSMFQRFTLAFEAARLADAAQESIPPGTAAGMEDAWIAAR